MNLVFRNAAIILFLFSFDGRVFGQNDYVVIDTVIFEGNRRTHNHILEYEMSIKKGDTISLVRMPKEIDGDEKRLQSMGLFTHAEVNMVNWVDNHVEIHVKVIENWHIYPYIIFELADRNFNVWRKEFNYSINRTNYGLALTNINFTGHKDRLRLKFQRGFLRKYEISYEFPYLYRGWGLSTNLLYSEVKELGYIPVNNRLVFYKEADERILYNQHRASITFHKRGSAYLTHLIRLEYYNGRVDSIISNELNPNFFGASRSRLGYWLMNYNLNWDRTVYPLYPTSGYQVELNVHKDGLSPSQPINNLWISVDVEHHHPFGKRFILSNRIKGKIHTINSPTPYILYSGIGYSRDVISGYQLQVLDGRNFFIFKNALKYRIFDKSFYPTMKLPKAVRTINVKMFLRANFDYGYVSDHIYATTNPLSNRNQYGYGPAVDIILLNNLTMTAEYSWMRDGTGGLFFGSGFNF